MANCDVSFRCDPTLDEFIDVVEGGRVYIPAVYVLNKIDAISIEELGKSSGPVVGKWYWDLRRIN